MIYFGLGNLPSVVVLYIMATVSVEQGKLRGGLATTDSGVQYYEFLCVPYAKPPTGNLRFKSPQPPEPWNGERDATKLNEKNIALQLDIMIKGIKGSEDCLYLNVYTPKILGNQTELLPVMLFIHGGGFICGNGIVKDELGPDYLVENDVVVVTINYRLDILGFLSLDIPEAAGNMGLKDQVQALKWVQKNIQQFGGDSNNVTIFGISAGSASVEYLLLSPLSEGLFHKAILQSGSTINHWASNYEPRKLLDVFLKEMGYQGSENEKDIHEFLLKASANEMIDISRKVSAEYTKDRFFFGFTPTIEKDLDTGDAFLTEHPYKLLKAGKFHRVPVIKGFCNKEGYLTCFMQPDAMLDVIRNKQFHKHFAFGIEEEDRKRLCAELQDAYVASEANPNKIGEDFFGDLDFVAGIWISGKIMADLGNPVYLYELSYDGNINFFKRLLGLMKEGAAHGDDTAYIFKHIDVSKFAEEKDIKVRSSLTKMWTNFAKTGVPTTKDSVIEWPAYTASTPVYLNIDENLSIKSNYEPKKIAAFEVIYDKYGK